VCEGINDPLSCVITELSSKKNHTSLLIDPLQSHYKTFSDTNCTSISHDEIPTYSYIFYNKGGQGDTTRRVKSDTFAGLIGKNYLLDPPRATFLTRSKYAVYV
jgi:hypothetical protein